MSLTAMIDSIKGQSDYKRVGMIVCHNGIVRGAARDGRVVNEIEVTADRRRLDDIIAEMRTRPGIIAVLVEVYEGRLKVGDDIMCVAVAGDIRENTFPVLEDAVNAIKRDVVTKVEI
ncbi:MAG: molybdenum cofactor biosynthesis protein MoaE [Syntrophales bacterium]